MSRHDLFATPKVEPELLKWSREGDASGLVGRRRVGSFTTVTKIELTFLYTS